MGAFIGLMSLFGVLLSLVSHSKARKKAVCEYIPHARRCTLSSRKHNEQRHGVSCDRSRGEGSKEVTVVYLVISTGTQVNQLGGKKKQCQKELKEPANMFL